MPLTGGDRDGFVRRIERRRRWVSRLCNAGKRLHLVEGSVQAAVHRATFRSEEELVAYSYAQTNDHLPDLEHPVWFNEKVRWQFLHHANPLMSLAAEKIAVRDYLRFKGARIDAPRLLATFDSPEEIADFDFPQRFALKAAFGTGHNHLSDGSRVTPRAELVRKAASWLDWDQWRSTGEFHYRSQPKRWLVEEFLPCSGGQVEYKIFCMMGRPIFVLVITDREGPNTYRRRVLDCDWKPAAFHWSGFPPETTPIPRPPDLDLMLEEAARLSEDFMHVRVDFLRCDDRLVFSELTFASSAARVPFTPVAANVMLGDMLDLERAQEYLDRGRCIARTLGWPVPAPVAEALPVPGMLHPAGGLAG